MLKEVGAACSGACLGGEVTCFLVYFVFLLSAGSTMFFFFFFSKRKEKKTLRFG